MPHYMIQVAFTPQAWESMAKKPQDRAEVVRPAIEKLGGKMESFYVSFGEYDIVTIVDMPDNVAAAALAIAAAAGGSLRAVRTTPLMTMREGMEAMTKAGASGYRPVG